MKLELQEAAADHLLLQAAPHFLDGRYVDPKLAVPRGSNTTTSNTTTTDVTAMNNDCDDTSSTITTSATNGINECAATLIATAADAFSITKTASHATRSSSSKHIDYIGAPVFVPSFNSPAVGSN